MSLILECLPDSIQSALEALLNRDALKSLQAAIKQSERILYLGDNAGEIVFDRLLIEQIDRQKVTFVVRGSPVINDATMEDARMTGMADIVEVIDNGSDAPGTILEDCSAEFRQRFKMANMIIAKGQGNYETLSQTNRKIFFLFKAKCPVIAEDVGCETGSYIVEVGGFGGKKLR